MKKSIIVVFLLVLFVLAGYYSGYRSGKHDAISTFTPDTVCNTYVDTIPYYYPVPKDSMVIRYEVVRLPAVENDSLTFGTNDSLVFDSASVVIPVESKVYQDSCYTAWVSGYNPRLDSLKVYPKNIYTKVTENRLIYKPNRWGLSLTAGYGYVPGAGMKPYVGVGISFTLMPLKWK